VGNLDLSIVVAYAFGIILLYIIGRILFIPLRFIFRLIFNGLIGGLLLWFLNIIGGAFGLHIAINPITALIAGFLGIPGVILLIALKYVLGA
jgi:inhibitor of the pro-sigma K processing machinery